MAEQLITLAAHGGPLPSLAGLVLVLGLIAGMFVVLAAIGAGVWLMARLEARRERRFEAEMIKETGDAS